MSYDAMTAHVAVVFTRYMMLAVENRASSDKRTLGELFYLIADEMADIDWMQAFQMLMDAFLSTLADKLSLTSSQLEQFMDSFLEALLHQLKSVLVCVFKIVDSCQILNFQGSQNNIHVRSMSKIYKLDFYVEHGSLSIK